MRIRPHYHRSILHSMMALGMAWLTAVTLAGCEAKASPTVERPPAPVSVAGAVTQDVPVYFDEVGKTVAREVVSIQPQVSGPITAIHFTDGADLKPGDPLFTIDRRPFEASLRQAEANLDRDRAQMGQAEGALAQSVAAEKQAEANLARDMAQLQNAQAQERRYKGLIDDGAVSREQYDQVRTAALAAEATVQADQAAINNAKAAIGAAQATVENAKAAIQADQAVVENARIQLGYTVIRSPINGRAGQRLVDLGNVVTANSSSLLTIQRLDPIYADFTVTENDLTAVQRNMTQGSLRVEVRLPDEPDTPRAGQLTFLDNAVQDATGTVKLRATVPNSDHRFWPGRFVKIRLVLRTLQGAVLIPAAAPQMSAKGPFVYVVKADATAELRPVVLGQRQGELVVIEQGLTPGERVVMTGQLGVTPGGKVRIDEPRVGGSAPAANTGGKS
jgi:membrane fusion protein, multidrug efflux system